MAGKHGYGYFVVLKGCARDPANAIEAAAGGERFSPEPNWYADFEKQYAVRRTTPAEPT